MAAMPKRCADHLFDDEALPEETRALRAAVRRVVMDVVEPCAYDIDQADEHPSAFPRDLYRSLASEGILGIPFEREDGGRGLRHPALGTTVMLEELAYSSNSVAAVVDVLAILAGHALAQAAPELRQRYLHPLVTGNAIASFATSEPGTSSDLSPVALSTIATPTEGGWRIEGRKRFITNAAVADFVVVLCRTGDHSTMFVVDLHTPGVRVGQCDLKTGNRGQMTADIVFDGAVVTDAHVVGQVGGGLRVALGSLTYGRLGVAASAVGMAQRAFDEAVQRLTARRAFGQRLAEFQHWQFRFAERATELENARSLYLKAARVIDRGVRLPEPEAAMAKYYATQLAVDLARDAVQVFGGYGFMRRLAEDGSTYKVEEIYRDAKITEIYEGTNEIQKWVIARQIFGRDVTG